MSNAIKLAHAFPALFLALSIAGCGGSASTGGAGSCAVVDGASPLVHAAACADARFNASHPRVSIDASRLALLQSKAGRLGDGSVAAPSTDENWQVIYPYLQAQAELTEGFDYGIQAWHFALAWLVTREEPFAQKAIQFAERMVQEQTSDPIDSSPQSPPCVARYPAELPRTDFAGPGSCLAGGQFLYAHHYVRNVALVYDWLHDRLTPEQKEGFRGYMRNAVDHVWNNRVDGGWALNDPANNYHYGYLAATVLQVLATWGEDDAAVRNWNFLVQDKWPGVFAYLKGQGRGGYWHEGTHYGRKSKHDLLEILLLLRDASAGRKLDIFKSPDFTYADELARFHLYSMQPDLFAKQGQNRYRGGGDYQVADNAPTLVQVGDLAGNAQGPVTIGDAAVMAMLADALSGQPMGEAAQYWLHELSGGVHRPRRARIHEFLFDDPSRAARDYRSGGGLPTFTATSQWFHSRSDWPADATSVSFFSAAGPQITSHQHRDQNSFVVWHKGWQAADLNSWSGGGLADDTAIHNTLLVDGQGQRTPILDPRFAANDPGYGRIAAVHDSAAAPGLRAVIGDAARAYGSLAEDERSVNLALDRFDRLLVHYKHIIVVGDSVVAAGASERSITYAVHSIGRFEPTADPRTYVSASPCGESMFAATGCIDAMQGGRMVHTTMLPVQPALRVVSGYQGRSSPAIGGFGLELNVGGAAMVLLNVMAFTDRTSTAIPVLESVDGGTGFIGARVVHEGEALIVLLRDDAAGAPLESASFDAGGSGVHALLVSGLVPGQYLVSQSDGTVVNAGPVGADGLLSASVRGGHRITVSRAQ